MVDTTRRPPPGFGEARQATATNAAVANPNGHQPSLEAKIAEALTGEMSSADLSALLTEAESAKIEAEAAATDLRNAALDPSRTPNRQAAREAMEDAQLAAGRLATMIPRLQKRYVAARQNEETQAWRAQRDAVAPMVAEAVEALRNEYPRLAGEIAQLMAKAEQADAEIRRVNNAKPYHAQGGGCFDSVVVQAFGRGDALRDLKLPYPNSARCFYPFKSANDVFAELALMTASMSASRADPRLTSPDWQDVHQERERDRIQAAAQADADKEREAAERYPGADWQDRGEAELQRRRAAGLP